MLVSVATSMESLKRVSFYRVSVEQKADSRCVCFLLCCSPLDSRKATRWWLARLRDFERPEHAPWNIAGTHTVTVAYTRDPPACPVGESARIQDLRPTDEMYCRKPIFIQRRTCCRHTLRQQLYNDAVPWWIACTRCWGWSTIDLWWE